jgi:hypothetical protein
VTAIDVQPSRDLPGAGIPATLPDQIQWQRTMSVLAYGVRIGVRVNDPILTESLADHLPPGSKYDEFSDTGRVYSLVVEEPDRSGRRRNAMYVNDALRARYSTLQAVLRVFQTDVQLYVAEMSPDRVFVHAGVVVCQGRGILLPGRSFTGKSTLVAELIRAGAEYYSDEYAVLDSAGGVYPYPRPLSIRPGGPGVPKQPVHALGAHARTGPLPVGLVVVSKFRSGGEWQPQRLSPGRGVLALLANTVPARRIPNVVLATLHQIVAGATVVASERGEASQVVEAILDLATRS